MVTRILKIVVFFLLGFSTTHVMYINTSNTNMARKSMYDVTIYLHGEL